MFTVRRCTAPHIIRGCFVITVLGNLTWKIYSTARNPSFVQTRIPAQRSFAEAVLYHYISRYFFLSSSSFMLRTEHSSTEICPSLCSLLFPRSFRDQYPPHTVRIRKNGSLRLELLLLDTVIGKVNKNCIRQEVDRSIAMETACVCGRGWALLSRTATTYVLRMYSTLPYIGAAVTSGPKSAGQTRCATIFIFKSIRAFLLTFTIPDSHWRLPT
jgi:hypothetical protein